MPAIVTVPVNVDVVLLTPQTSVISTSTVPYPVTPIVAVVNVANVVLLQTPPTLVFPISAVTVPPPVPPVVAKVNISGVRHLVADAPIRVWNGEAWVILYAPRM